MSDLENKFAWEHFKPQFDNILDRKTLEAKVIKASSDIKNNIVPSATAICC